MLEHTSSSQESQASLRLSAPESISGSSPQTLPEYALDAIEDYLDRICAPMVPYVPYGARQERRREMRSHLEALATAYIELGSDPEEAATLAIRQFGNPRCVTRQWFRE